MPAEAEKPCSLWRVPPNPTEADKELGLMMRGVQIVECDGRRALATDTHREEHKLEARWKEMRDDRARPWWKFWGRLSR